MNVVAHGLVRQLQFFASLIMGVAFPAWLLDDLNSICNSFWSLMKFLF